MAGNSKKNPTETNQFRDRFICCICVHRPEPVIGCLKQEPAKLGTGRLLGCRGWFLTSFFLRILLGMALKEKHKENHHLRGHWISPRINLLAVSIEPIAGPKGG